jgi:hypothetical protein
VTDFRFSPSGASKTCEDGCQHETPAFWCFLDSSGYHFGDIRLCEARTCSNYCYSTPCLNPQLLTNFRREFGSLRMSVFQVALSFFKVRTMLPSWTLPIVLLPTMPLPTKPRYVDRLALAICSANSLLG